MLHFEYEIRRYGFGGLCRKDEAMTLEDILPDIYALEDEMRAYAYERKHGVLSKAFCESA